MNSTQILAEIEERYKNSPVRRNLAKKCLEKANEWWGKTEMPTLDNSYAIPVAKKNLKKDLNNYIKDNLDTSEEDKVYGSVLLVIVLGAIISWLVQRLLDEMFP